MAINEITDDLWKHTWDQVMEKHNIEKETFDKSIQVLDALDLTLIIKPYKDYHFVRSLPVRKFLVTTSITALQQKKIKALGIENDFEAVYINDPLMDKKTKFDVFRNLVSTYGLIPDRTYVVGDNNDSEIKAGKRLGMVTIQMLRPNVVKGNDADHHIRSFEELSAILNNK